MVQHNDNRKNRDAPSSSGPDDGDDDGSHTHRLMKKKKHKRRDHSSSSSGNSRDHDTTSTDRHRDICLPPQGKTYLTIGQDLYSIQEYLAEQQNASLHWYMDRMAYSSSNSNNNANDYYSMRLPVPNPDDAVPAAVMVYTDIQTLRGLDRPVDYGSGIEYADGTLQMAMASHHHHHPHSTHYDTRDDASLDVGLQIGLWLNGTEGCHDIVDGKLDHKIHQLVYYLGSTCPANKIFLRIGYGTFLSCRL